MGFKSPPRSRQSPPRRRQSSSPTRRSVACGASASSADPVPRSCAHHVDAQSFKDIVTEIIAANVRGILLNIQGEQANLGARLDAIWGSMIKLEEKVGLPLSPSNGFAGVGVTTDLMKAADMAASAAAQPTAPDSVPHQSGLPAEATGARRGEHTQPTAPGSAPRQLGLSAEATGARRGEHSSLNAIETSDSIQSFCMDGARQDGSFMGSSRKGSNASNYLASQAQCPSPSIVTLDVYDLADMHTDQLFETNGLAECSSDKSASPPTSWPLRRRFHRASIPEAGASPGSNLVPNSSVANTIDPAVKMASRFSKSLSGIDALRAKQDSVLVARTTCFAERVRAESDMPLSGLPGSLLEVPYMAFCVFGVLPWRSRGPARWYRNFVLLLVLLALLHSVVQAAQAVSERHLLYMHVSAACYAFGGLLGAVSLKVQNVQNLLGPESKPLETYARNCGFFEEWRRVSLRRFAVIFVLWSCIVLVRVFSTLDTRGSGGIHSSAAASDLCAFALTSGLLAVLTSCQLHVCCGLEMAVDNFCVRFFTELDVARGITEWNVLQAILRRSAHVIEASFLAVNTSVVATLVLTGIEVLQESRDPLGPAEPTWACTLIRWSSLLPPMVLVLYTVFRAAAITEKCSRVPALVNSWMVEERRLDGGRQYIVQYITNCVAGFYVKGVRLSAFMAMKLAYFFGIVVFTLVSQSMLGT